MTTKVLTAIMTVGLMGAVTIAPLGASAADFNPDVQINYLGGSGTATYRAGSGFARCNSYLEEGGTAVVFTSAYLTRKIGVPEGNQILKAEHYFSPSAGQVDVQVARSTNNGASEQVTMEGRAITNTAGSRAITFYNGFVRSRDYGLVPIYATAQVNGGTTNVQNFPVYCRKMKRQNAEESEPFWKVVRVVAPVVLKVLKAF